MHAFRLVSPFPVAQFQLMCLLADIQSKKNQRTCMRLVNQTHVVQRHNDAVWITPKQVVPKGLTRGHVHLTNPFNEYMRIQLEALFDTEPGKVSIHSPNPLKSCYTLDVLSPRLTVTFVHTAVIIQGIGNGELIDSDEHFDDLICCLIDLRTDLRTAVLMALHPRLGADSKLSTLGEDMIHTLCTLY